MDLLSWVVWALSIVLGVLGGWAVSADDAKKLRVHLGEARAQNQAILDLAEQTRGDVARIEQGEVLKDHGAESLGPTIELAVSFVLGAIVREAEPRTPPEKVEQSLGEAAPRLLAQWKTLTPAGDARLKLIAELQTEWSELVRERTAAGVRGTSRGGVRLGKSLWIPAYAVAKIHNVDPLSIEARVAEKRWYGRARSLLAAATIFGGVIGLFLSPLMSGELAVAVLFGWAMLLAVTISFYNFNRILAEERARRPDWAVLFPPGAIMDAPCHVEFGTRSRTIIAPFPLSAWVDTDS